MNGDQRMCDPSRDGDTPTDRTLEPVRYVDRATGRPATAHTPPEDRVPVDETITDRAAIRDSDEPSERGDFPYYDLGPATSETVGALNLDAIKARATRAGQSWVHDPYGHLVTLVGYDVPALVAEVERLRQDIDECWVPLYHDTKHERDQATARAEAAETEVRSLRAKVAAVEAVADALTTAARIERRHGLAYASAVIEAVQADLRAALATGEGK